jgi:hypothetical protein
VTVTPQIASTPRDSGLCRCTVYATIIDAEATGYESLWAVQHVVVPVEHESRYRYSESGTIPGGRYAGRARLSAAGPGCLSADARRWSRLPCSPRQPRAVNDGFKHLNKVL